ncbi:uncharacterized protein LOC134541093 [Bacillus rossius redtenbacheri]|uniref:uncharacterized protein LOC134541093 n=1 Tax=Bacillus rossius redtenbacheri TaxID=93214 RepID=UPI002FDDA565
MARIFDKWFMLPSTEIIVFSVAGICSTVMEESVLTIPERLEQVLRFDYRGYEELQPFELSAAKSAMCMDVLGRRLAAPVYLLSYFLVVWVAFFGKYPRLLVPWLVIGFFRHLMLNHVSMLTGAYLGARGELTWSLLQFVLVKVFEIMMYAYLWYSVLLLYRGLRLLETLEDVATIVQPPGTPAPQTARECCPGAARRQVPGAAPRRGDGDAREDGGDPAGPAAVALRGRGPLGAARRLGRRGRGAGGRLQAARHGLPGAAVPGAPGGARGSPVPPRHLHGQLLRQGGAGEHH